MADSLLEATREVLSESLQDLTSTLEGRSAEEMNRRPAGEDTNGLAVLVIHALYSTRSWLSLATGAELPPRDRPAEFRTVVDNADNFRTLAGRIAAECRALLNVSTFDPAATGVATWTGDEPESVTAAWALLHAVSHLGEHVGHAQLTRDVVSGAPGS